MKTQILKVCVQTHKNTQLKVPPVLLWFNVFLDKCLVQRVWLGGLDIYRLQDLILRLAEAAEFSFRLKCAGSGNL